MNQPIRPLQAGLSFNNGVFEALISDASTWNVDGKGGSSCMELRIYPPASMLEGRKVTDDGPLPRTGFETGGFVGGNAFSLDKPIGIRQTNAGGATGVDSTKFDRLSNTWPVRITRWPKRDWTDKVMDYNFEFYEPPADNPFNQPDPNAPAVGSAKYTNPKQGDEPLCVINSGADSNCKLKRINNQNKGANGSTIGGTA